MQNTCCCKQKFCGKNVLPSNIKAPITNNKRKKNGINMSKPRNYQSLVLYGFDYLSVTVTMFCIFKGFESRLQVLVLLQTLLTYSSVQHIRIGSKVWNFTYIKSYETNVLIIFSRFWLLKMDAITVVIAQK